MANCVDCFATEISCCTTEDECCGGVDPCLCHWDGAKCFCTFEQCEADENGEVCTIDVEEGCECYKPDHLGGTLGKDYDGRMIFEDLLYNQIRSVSEFCHEFVRVAARSTGCEEDQFVRHQVYMLADPAPPRMLRGGTTSPLKSDDGAELNWAAEAFRVVDSRSVSARGVMESLQDQSLDPSSHFYREFIVPQGASGAIMEYEATPSDNMWMIIAIVFISLFGLLLFGVVVFMCYRCCAKEKGKGESAVPKEKAAAEKAEAAADKAEVAAEKAEAAAEKTETMVKAKSGVADVELVGDDLVT